MVEENKTKDDSIKTDTSLTNNREFNRAVAKISDIKSLKNGVFIHRDGFDPSYVETVFGQISRVNLIGVIVSKSSLEETFDIEDGSDKIRIRKSSLYSDIVIDNFKPGDLVNIIGKPRDFNNEIFIIPEIIKKIKNKLWVDIRKIELSSLDVVCSEEKIKELKTEKIERKKIQKEMEDQKDKLNKDFFDADDDKDARKLLNEKKNNLTNNSSKLNLKEEDFDVSIKKNEEEASNPEIVLILNTIRKLDLGDGVDIQKILEEINISNGKSIIKSLLELGEIFEIRPERVKILE
jgi:RPA family protein